jgi:hypothetical protein
MSVLKSFVLATAVVLGLATFANAAVYHGGYYYNHSSANTATAEHFQDQFRNSY